eukprot:4005143-Amphidinium_carterae.1
MKSESHLPHNEAKTKEADDNHDLQVHAKTRFIGSLEHSLGFTLVSGFVSIAVDGRTESLHGQPRQITFPLAGVPGGRRRKLSFRGRGCKI